MEPNNEIGSLKIRLCTCGHTCVMMNEIIAKIASNAKVPSSCTRSQMEKQGFWIWGKTSNRWLDTQINTHHSTRIYFGGEIKGSTEKLLNAWKSRKVECDAAKKYSEMSINRKGSRTHSTILRKNGISGIMSWRSNNYENTGLKHS